MKVAQTDPAVVFPLPWRIYEGQEHDVESPHDLWVLRILAANNAAVVTSGGNDNNWGKADRELNRNLFQRIVERMNEPTETPRQDGPLGDEFLDLCRKAYRALHSQQKYLDDRNDGQLSHGRAALKSIRAAFAKIGATL